MCGVTPEPVRRLTVGRLGRFSFYLRTKTRKNCTRDPVRDISSVMSLTSRHCLPLQPVDFSAQKPGNVVEPTLHPLHRLLYTYSTGRPMFQWLFGKSKRPSAEAEARRMAGCREVVLQYAGSWLHRAGVN